MIDKSYPELYALHLKAVRAMAATGIHPDTLQFLSELHEVSKESRELLRRLDAADVVAVQAGVSAPVMALTEPARIAVTALLWSVNDESRDQREKSAHAE